METRRALLVDAFTAEPLAGNPAGVVPDAEGLSDGQLAAVAAELGASETAFLTDGDGAADDRLRYFSPTTEVDLCGHATIATYGALFAEGAIDGGERTLRTNVGDLTVSVDDDGTVWMRQQAPSVEVVDVDAGRLGEALGVDPAALRDVGADLPVAVASTGLPFLVVPVNFLERLGEADPNDAAVERLSEEFDVAGARRRFDAPRPGVRPVARDRGGPGHGHRERGGRRVPPARQRLRRGRAGRVPVRAGTLPRPTGARPRARRARRRPRRRPRVGRARRRDPDSRRRGGRDTRGVSRAADRTFRIARDV